MRLLIVCCKRGSGVPPAFQSWSFACAEAAPGPVLCAAILDKQVALGLGTGELFVYNIEALLTALVEAQAAKQPTRANTAPVGTLPETQEEPAGVL